MWEGSRYEVQDQAAEAGSGSGEARSRLRPRFGRDGRSLAEGAPKISLPQIFPQADEQIIHRSLCHICCQAPLEAWLP